MRQSGRRMFRKGLLAAAICVLSGAVWAGGAGFGDDDDLSEDDGPSYFGFVKDTSGRTMPDVKVTVGIKDRGGVVTRTDALGAYKVPGFGKEVDRKDIGDFELVDRDEAERPWRERIAKHFLHAGGDARRASGLFGQDQIPRSRAAQIGDQRILPIALVDGLEPMPPALFCNHPQQQLLASCELLHRMRDMAVPALLDPCKDAIAYAQRTPPPALDNAKPGRRDAFRFPAFGNSDYLPVVDIGDPENRHFRETAHLVEGPAGC